MLSKYSNVTRVTDFSIGIGYLRFVKRGDSKMPKRTEEFKVSGSDVVKKIKELINEGNIRKITIKDKSGKTFAEFPLTIGVVGTVILPVVAAIGTIIALVAECTISVEKEENGHKDKEVVETEEKEGKDAK